MALRKLPECICTPHFSPEPCLGQEDFSELQVLRQRTVQIACGAIKGEEVLDTVAAAVKDEIYQVLLNANFQTGIHRPLLSAQIATRSPTSDWGMSSFYGVRHSI
jgi:hypothetical protein